ATGASVGGMVERSRPGLADRDWLDSRPPLRVFSSRRPDRPFVGLVGLAEGSRILYPSAWPALVSCRVTYMVWASRWLCRAWGQHYYVFPMRTPGPAVAAGGTDRCRLAHIWPAHNGHDRPRPLERVAGGAGAASIRHLCCACRSGPGSGQPALARTGLAEGTPPAG